MKTILLLIYIAMILAVIFVERKRPTEAMLWVLILVCLPYLGGILYLIFGSTTAIKLTAYLRKKKLNCRYSDIPQENVKIDDSLLSEEDKQVIKFNSSYNDSLVTCYDNINIYTSGKSHYEQLFTDIKNAKECIYIEFFTIQVRKQMHK